MMALEPIVTLEVVSEMTDALAFPTETNPPPELVAEDDVLEYALPEISILSDERIALEPMLTLTVGELVDETSALATRTRSAPPLVLAELVTTPSPEGALANDRAPPIPSSLRVPLLVPVKSIVN
jgi:hypothetical protein